MPAAERKPVAPKHGTAMGRRVTSDSNKVQAGAAQAGAAQAGAAQAGAAQAGATHANAFAGKELTNKAAYIDLIVKTLWDKVKSTRVEVVIPATPGKSEKLDKPTDSALKEFQSMKLEAWRFNQSTKPDQYTTSHFHAKQGVAVEELIRRRLSKYWNNQISDDFDALSLPDKAIKVAMLLSFALEAIGLAISEMLENPLAVADITFELTKSFEKDLGPLAEQIVRKKSVDKSAGSTRKSDADKMREKEAEAQLKAMGAAAVKITALVSQGNPLMQYLHKEISQDETLEILYSQARDIGIPAAQLHKEYLSRCVVELLSYQGDELLKERDATERFATTRTRNKYDEMFMKEYMVSMDTPYGKQNALRVGILCQKLEKVNPKNKPEPEAIAPVPLSDDQKAHKMTVKQVALLNRIAGKDEKYNTYLHGKHVKDDNTRSTEKTAKAMLKGPIADILKRSKKYDLEDGSTHSSLDDHASFVCDKIIDYIQNQAPITITVGKSFFAKGSKGYNTKYKSMNAAKVEKRDVRLKGSFGEQRRFKAIEMPEVFKGDAGDRGADYRRFRVWKDQLMTKRIGLGPAEFPVFAALNWGHKVSLFGGLYAAGGILDTHTVIENREKMKELQTELANESANSERAKQIRKELEQDKYVDPQQHKVGANYYGSIHMLLKPEAVKERCVYTATDNGKPRRDPLLALCDFLDWDPKRSSQTGKGASTNVDTMLNGLIDAAVTGRKNMVGTGPATMYEVQIYGKINIATDVAEIYLDSQSEDRAIVETYLTDNNMSHISIKDTNQVSEQQVTECLVTDKELEDAKAPYKHTFDSKVEDWEDKVSGDTVIPGEERRQQEIDQATKRINLSLVKLNQYYAVARAYEQAQRTQNPADIRAAEQVPSVDNVVEKPVGNLPPLPDEKETKQPNNAAKDNAISSESKSNAPLESTVEIENDTVPASPVQNVPAVPPANVQTTGGNAAREPEASLAAQNTAVTTRTLAQVASGNTGKDSAPTSPTGTARRTAPPSGGNTAAKPAPAALSFFQSLEQASTSTPVTRRTTPAPGNNAAVKSAPAALSLFQSLEQTSTTTSTPVTRRTTPASGNNAAVKPAPAVNASLAAQTRTPTTAPASTTTATTAPATNARPAAPASNGNAGGNAAPAWVKRMPTPTTLPRPVTPASGGNAGGNAAAAAPPAWVKRTPTPTTLPRPAAPASGSNMAPAGAPGSASAVNQKRPLPGEKKKNPWRFARRFG